MPARMASKWPSRQYSTQAKRQLGTIKIPGSMSLRVQWLVLFLITVGVCATVGIAQSGRRPPKPTATSTEPPSPPPSTEAELAAAQPAKKIRILVGRQPSSKHLQTEDRIYAEFVKKLSEQKIMEVTEIGELKRETAILRARNQTDQYVVLMQTEIDSFQHGTIVLNSPDLEIKYFAFSPITGKQKYHGKVYYQAIGGARARKDAWPNGPPIKITPEGAAIAAADQLYDLLLLSAGVTSR